MFRLVSILVFVELALDGIDDNKDIVRSLVSILVFVELALDAFQPTPPIWVGS